MLYFALPGNEAFAQAMVDRSGGELGALDFRYFPDGESYLRVRTDVKGRTVTLVCTLDRPDRKLLPLYFLAETVRQLGAAKVELLVPYLAYMRQDRRFEPGEAVTSELFAALVSRFADRLTTVDPHLHRHTNLSEIYSIPTRVVHAAQALAHWVAKNIERPLLIGPDVESEQWVGEVAKMVGAPYVVLRKTRMGDRSVDVAMPKLDAYLGLTPVLVDDIVSTAQTLIIAVRKLRGQPLNAPVCIAVHGLFAGDAYSELQQAGAVRIVTTNCVPHPSNGIDIVPYL